MDTGSSSAPHWQSKPHSQSGTNLPAGRGTVATKPTWLDRADGYQQSHRWLAIPFAVFRKFIDDQAGSLAALIAYYAFFSIFPLLLVLTTILGYVLVGDPALEHRIFSTALSQFPITGQHSTTHPLTGNPVALVIGLVLAIWSGLALPGWRSRRSTPCTASPRGVALVHAAAAAPRKHTAPSGTFAVVIGLLFWFFVLSQITLFCAEANVVLSRRLWPRGLRSLTEYRATPTADRVSYEGYPQRERQVYNLRVDAQVTNRQSDSGRF